MSTDERFVGKSIPVPAFADDDGQAPSEVLTALTQYKQGALPRAELFATLQETRVFVPVKAILDSSEIDDHGHQVEKDSHMATVSIQAPDGRKALLAFTSTDAMKEWDDQARPIAAAFATAVAASLDEGADALLLDFGTDHQIAVIKRELLLIANQLPVLDPLDDEVAMAAVSQVLQQVATKYPVRFEVMPTAVADIAIVAVGATADTSDDVLREVAAGLQAEADLRLRLAGGVSLSARSED